MKYKLETNISTFEIQKEPLGLWDLWVDNMPTLTFSTPEEAAIAVYNRQTGYTVWDMLEEHSAPSDLSGWQKVDG
ncbi:MAG: hypothetical protein ACRBDX_05085 [Gammaproteobacteria bacterium]